MGHIKRDLDRSESLKRVEMTTCSKYWKGFRNNPRWPSRYEKKVLKERRDMYMGVKERISILRTALTRAAIHTRSVMMREHVLPERHARIGEFVTSLRRELAALMPSDQTLKTFLLKVDTWEDILELSSRSGIDRLKLTNLNETDVRMTINDALAEFEQEDSHENLSSCLSGIQSSIHSMDRILRDIEGINNDATIVLNDLRKLGQEET